MIEATHTAIKGVLQNGLPASPGCVFLWGHGEEHAPNVPVADLTIPRVTVEAISLLNDRIRQRVPQRFGKQVLANSKLIYVMQRYWEPNRIMYQIDVRVEGPSAQQKMWALVKTIRNLLRNATYVDVIADPYGTGDLFTIPVLVNLQDETVIRPDDGVNRREFRYVFTYLVDSGVFDANVNSEVPATTELDVSYTVDSPTLDTPNATTETETILKPGPG